MPVVPHGISLEKEAVLPWQGGGQTYRLEGKAKLRMLIDPEKGIRQGIYWWGGSGLPISTGCQILNNPCSGATEPGNKLRCSVQTWSWWLTALSIVSSLSYLKEDPAARKIPYWHLGVWGNIVNLSDQGDTVKKLLSPGDKTVATIPGKVLDSEISHLFWFNGKVHFLKSDWDVLCLGRMFDIVWD